MDNYFLGMTLGTTSPAAAAAYGEGLDRMLAFRVGATDHLATAIAADTPSMTR